MNLFGFNISTGYLIAAAIALFLLVTAGLYSLGHHNGYVAGGLQCQVDQAAAQKVADDKAKLDNERIDHETPYTGSRDARINWLLDNARRSK